MSNFESKEFIGGISGADTEVLISSPADALDVFDKDIVPFFAGMPDADQREVGFALADLADFLEAQRNKGRLRELRVSVETVRTLNETLREAHRLAGLIEITAEDRDAISERLGKVRALLVKL